jgi:hypothetical protein
MLDLRTPYAHPAAGQTKIDRNVEMGIRLFLGQLH